MAELRVGFDDVVQMIQEKLEEESPTFHQFQSLPVELRQAIWDLALLIPEVIVLERYIEIVTDLHGDEYTMKDLVPRNCPMKASIRFVNTESRARAKQVMVAMDGSKRHCYANLEVDVVWLRDYDQMNIGCVRQGIY